ncbi:hypothetical protein ABIE89_009106 [Bradyrhizobium niftali]|uniref:hypothetical protein n=1 Tax=Bradyrhizobium niftali TaxID=2560055 RepID=UPI003839BE77
MKLFNMIAAAAVTAYAAAIPTATRAETSTECTPNGLCYCVQDDLKSVIATRVEEIRARISAQRQQGKAIGYLSIPISTIQGSYLPVNVKIAARTKERVEERFGPRSLWLLNTAAKEFSLPEAAKGEDYMLMWTRVLEGPDGFGRDFDFIYFAGPSDFANYFSFDGRADLEKLERFYEGLAKTDSKLAEIKKADFRNYYGLRASVAFSFGSHDEWNIARTINAKRTAKREGEDAFGIAKQIAVMFNGTSVAPGLFDASTATGNEGQCRLTKK